MAKRKAQTTAPKEEAQLKTETAPKPKSESRTKPVTRAAAKAKPVVDDFDSSDEEDLRNNIGNIPLQWYDDEEHIGYDLEGRKILKTGSKKGEIDAFLEKIEDPDYWRKVFDRQTGGDVVLTDEQVEKLSAIAQNRFPQIGYNPYEPFYDIFSSQKEIHPISNRPEDKRSFIPSAHERRIVGRMVHAIKMGWWKQHEKKEEPKVYDLWASEDNNSKSKNELSRLRMHLPAPKMTLPTHAESYNPPSEYLFDEEELKKWEETEPEKRRIGFQPQKYDALRKVPFYDQFYNEQFERCMDLHLAPRQRKLRLNVDPKELLPDLPNPEDLRPFPTTLAFYMRGHKGQVRSISVEPDTGELLASGGQDGTVRIWYVPTGRCLRTFEMGAPVTCVAYCPNSQRTLLLVSCESNVVSLLNVQSGDKLAVSQTQKLLDSLELPSECSDGDVKWTRNKKNGHVELHMPDKIRQVTWHRKGDYFATVGFESSAKTVFIHQLSKTSSQKPFSKKKGHIHRVLFHPTAPRFFVATQQHIRVYDLAKCQLQKKLFTGSKWVSCMELDTHGNNLFVGGLDRVFSWIDLELSAKPWKSLKNHGAAIRGVSYHGRYPLLATVSDDATAIVYHARIPQDLMRENELVPVKRLFAHKTTAKKSAQESGEKPKSPELSILSTVFHPTQPWLITAGADGLIGLFSY